MEVKHRGTSDMPETGTTQNVEPIELDNTSTLVVVAFSDDCPEETKEWLKKLFSAPGENSY